MEKKRQPLGSMLQPKSKTVKQFEVVVVVGSGRVDDCENNRMMTKENRVVLILLFEEKKEETIQMM